jgi:hypothetical protein
MEHARDNNFRVASLIEEQRRLSNSQQPFERMVGSFLLADMLNHRLAALSDRQIGQLLADLVWDRLELFSPEVVICEHATQRLFRSFGGGFTVEDIEKQKHGACPRCGNEMLLHFGIDEPDFYECPVLACGHKELLDSTRRDGR